METITIFEVVAQKLETDGFSCTPEQHRAKWKQEKARFFDIMEFWDGHPPWSERPPRFRHLKKLRVQANHPCWGERCPGGKCESAVLNSIPKLQIAKQALDCASSTLTHFPRLHHCRPVSLHSNCLVAEMYECTGWCSGVSLIEVSVFEPHLPCPWNTPEEA